MSTNIPALEATNNQQRPPTPPRSSSDSAFSFDQPPTQDTSLSDLDTLDRTSSTTVQIPVALLDSLLNTIDALRNEVDLLHNDLIDRINTMSSEYKTVNNNMEDYLRAKTFQRFTCFSRLPLELRRQIWNAALDIPQIIPMKLTNVPLGGDANFLQSHASPLSKHSHLLEVNRESRLEAKKVYVQSQVSAHKCASHPHNTIFANLANDILWLHDSSEPHALRSFISIVGAHFSQSKAPEAKPICRVVVLHTAWVDYMSSSLHDFVTPRIWIMRYMHRMAELGLRKLILIVNDETTSRSTNVLFTAPKQTPRESGIRPALFDRMSINLDCSWSELETGTNKFLIGVQEKRVVERQRLLSSGMSEAVMNEQHDHLQKCEGWTPPTFTYVDAIDGPSGFS